MTCKEYKLFYHSIAHRNNWFLQNFVDPCCIEEDRHDVPMEDCWYARPQLFFTCVLRPNDGRLPKNRTYKTGPNDRICTLVFFSTFEELKLPTKGPMEDAGVIKLYEPSPTPCLYNVYMADVQNMVGRVPLIQLFLAGNLTPTIPHMFSKRKESGSESGFPYGCANAAATDGRRGSNVYEVNPWLWQLGRGKPRLGGLTIEETSERKDAVSNARCKRAADSEQRQYVIAKRLQPDDSKYMVLYDSMYEYVRV